MRESQRGEVYALVGVLVCVCVLTPVCVCVCVCVCACACVVLVCVYVCVREVKTTHWSILDRMRLVGENIKCVAESPSGMSLI